MDQRIKKDLEECIAALEGNILAASTELADMKPGQGYTAQAKALDSLGQSLQKALNGYSSIIEAENNKKLKKENKIEWTRIITCLLAGGLTLVQTGMIYKWQQQGYLFRNDVTKLQMPRLI